MKYYMPGKWFCVFNYFFLYSEGSATMLNPIQLIQNPLESIIKSGILKVKISLAVSALTHGQTLGFLHQDLPDQLLLF